MNPLPSIARRGLVAAAAALALSPALASADSILYVKDADVWRASGDGGNQYQVTTDGTADHPYRSPSQADDGTIAVGYGDEILRMKQNGINIQDLGTAPYNWLTDQATDLGDAEVTRAGDKYAAVRGYGNSTHIIWERVKGNVLSGPKPAELPEGICSTNEQPGFDQPTWSPDGTQLAWAEPDGIWVHRDAEACTTPSPAVAGPPRAAPRSRSR